MAQAHDVVVVGLGGMGSAVAAQLAERGLRVHGIERHGIAHNLGSSHGESRVIRQAYFESPAYVPLLLRAYQLWHTVGPEEAAPLLGFSSSRLPALGPEVCAAVACMYTTTPDEHFVLGFAPGDERLVICWPCSGHGFKFVPVIGEVAADLITSGGAHLDISWFDPARFSGPSLPADDQARE
jgi:glycine/D-amino acid oxidase-like deaminating enzyme